MNLSRGSRIRVVITALALGALASACGSSNTAAPQIISISPTALNALSLANFSYNDQRPLFSWSSGPTATTFQIQTCDAQGCHNYISVNCASHVTACSVTDANGNVLQNYRIASANNAGRASYRLDLCSGYSLGLSAGQSYQITDDIGETATAQLNQSINPVDYCQSN